MKVIITRVHDTWKFALFFILANGLFIIVSIPMIAPWLATPPHTIYTGVHGTPIDYYQYLGVIKEGMNGSWLTSDLYTTELTQKTLVFIFYILIGKIGGVFHMSSVVIYHVARIAVFELLILTIYGVCKEIVGRTYAFWAAMIGLFSTVPPVMYSKTLQTILGDTLWWDVLDPLHRADYIPHHAFGIAALLSCVMYVIRFLRTGRIYQFFIALLSAIAAGFVYPTPGLLLVIALLGAGKICLLRSYLMDKRWNLKQLLPVVVIAFGAGMSLFIMAGEIGKGFPWSGWKDAVRSGPWYRIGYFEQNFVLGSGLTFFVGLPMLFVNFLRGNFSEVFVSIWSLTPILLVIVSTVFGLEKIRMAYMGQFVANGILATMSIRWFINHVQSQRKKMFILGLFAVVFALNLFLTSGYFFQNRLRDQIKSGENIHLPMRLIPAFIYIDQHVPMYSNVLGDFIVGNILPAYATVHTYFGHWTQTSDYWRKEAESKILFEGKYSPLKAAAFLRREHIQFIIVRMPDERKAIEELMGNIELDTIYQDGDIRLYKVGETSLQ